MDYSDHIRKHMEVVGSDGKHVGTVDHLEGVRLKLTKSDPNAESDKVCLNVSCDQAMQTWQT